MSSIKRRKVGEGSRSERPSKVVKSSSKREFKKKAPPSEPQSGESDDQDGEEIDKADENIDGETLEQNGEDATRNTTTEDADETATSATNPNDQVTKTFADLGVREELCDACDALKYKHPTPIQVESIPLALEGRDVIGLAETGSGKTAAFVLPILQALLEKPQALFGLILAPTRELAYQIAQQVDALGSIINVKSAILVGGMDMVPQAIALSKKPHIVVATPGVYRRL